MINRVIDLISRADGNPKLDPLADESVGDRSLVKTIDAADYGIDLVMIFDRQMIEFFGTRSNRH